MDLDRRTDSDNRNLAVLLLAFGLLALLAQIGFFRGLGDILGALIFGAAGLYLVRRHYRSDLGVWALIVGFALLGLGAAAISGPLSGTAFLGFIAAGFVIAYRDDRSRWWALIPAGVLLTLALVAGLDGPGGRWASGPIFFLGLAATFGYLHRFAPVRRPWAIYPAVVFAVLALLSLSAGSGWLLPLVLIGGGLYLLNRQRDRRIGVDGLLRDLGERVEGVVAAGERFLRGVGSERAPREAESRAESGAPAHGEATAPRGTTAGTPGADVEAGPSEAPAQDTPAAGHEPDGSDRAA